MHPYWVILYLKVRVFLTFYFYIYNICMFFVSLFYVISTIVGYLMPILSLSKKSITERMRWFHTLPKDISPKSIVLGSLEFNLASFMTTAQHFSRDATETHPHPFLCCFFFCTVMRLNIPKLMISKQTYFIH